VCPSRGPSDLEHTARRRAIADELLGLDGVHLLALNRSEPSTDSDAEHPRGLLRLTVETERPEVVACRDCGVLAADHGRREHRLADAPCFGTPVQLI
jgi:transposase